MQPTDDSGIETGSSFFISTGNAGDYTLSYKHLVSISILN